MSELCEHRVIAFAVEQLQDFVESALAFPQGCQSDELVQRFFEFVGRNQLCRLELAQLEGQKLCVSLARTLITAEVLTKSQRLSQLAPDALQRGRVNVAAFVDHAQHFVAAPQGQRIVLTVDHDDVLGEGSQGLRARGRTVERAAKSAGVAGLSREHELFALALKKSNRARVVG